MERNATTRIVLIGPNILIQKSSVCMETNAIERILFISKNLITGITKNIHPCYQINYRVNEAKEEESIKSLNPWYQGNKDKLNEYKEKSDEHDRESEDDADMEWKKEVDDEDMEDVVKESEEEDKNVEESNGSKDYDDKNDVTKIAVKIEEKKDEEGQESIDDAQKVVESMKEIKEEGKVEKEEAKEVKKETVERDKESEDDTGKTEMEEEGDLEEHAINGIKPLHYMKDSVQIEFGDYKLMRKDGVRF
jgi:hypothetical protein